LLDLPRQITGCLLDLYLNLGHGADLGADRSDAALRQRWLAAPGGLDCVLTRRARLAWN
jgi:hypothetical protein